MKHRQPDSPPKRHKHRRAGILLLTALLTGLVAVPGLAVIIGGCAALVLIWVLLCETSDKAPAADSQTQGEPALWDDGYGAT